VSARTARPHGSVEAIATSHRQVHDVADGHGVPPSHHRPHGNGVVIDEISTCAKQGPPGHAAGHDNMSHAPGCPLVLQRVADAIDDGWWFDEHPKAARPIRWPSAAELAELRVLADLDTADHQ